MGNAIKKIPLYVYNITKINNNLLNEFKDTKEDIKIEEKDGFIIITFNKDFYDSISMDHQYVALGTIVQTHCCFIINKSFTTKGYFFTTQGKAPNLSTLMEQTIGIDYLQVALFYDKELNYYLNHPDATFKIKQCRYNIKAIKQELPLYKSDEIESFAEYNIPKDLKDKLDVVIELKTSDKTLNNTEFKTFINFKNNVTFEKIEIEASINGKEKKIFTKQQLNPKSKVIKADVQKSVNLPYIINAILEHLKNNNEEE